MACSSFVIVSLYQEFYPHISFISATTFLHFFFAKNAFLKYAKIKRKMYR